MLENFSEIQLLDGLSLWQLELLKPLFEIYVCPEDTVIFEQGDEAIYLYLILSGSVAVEYKPYDAPMITITHLKAGNAFGWSAVVGSPAYTSRVRSVEAMDSIRIRGRDLERLCMEHPTTGSILLDRLARMVSSRWKNARSQVKSMLRKGMKTQDLAESAVE